MAKVLQPQHNLPLMCADYSGDVTPAAVTTATTGSSNLTSYIAKRSVRILLENEGFTVQRILNSIDLIDEDIDRKKVERIAEIIRKLIKESSPSELPSVAELAEQQWIIHAGNVHSEYMHLANQLFQDGVNWGRIIAFIGFSATYCLYAMQRGIQETIVESVCAWMVQVLQQDLQEWFCQHSWDQFIKYSDKQLANTRNPTGWLQRYAAVGGAIGLGAVIAFTIGNALS